VHDEEVGPRLASLGDCDRQEDGQITEDDEGEEASAEDDAFPLQKVNIDVKRCSNDSEMTRDALVILLTEYFKWASSMR